MLISLADCLRDVISTLVLMILVNEILMFSEQEPVTVSKCASLKKLSRYV